MKLRQARGMAGRRIEGAGVRRSNVNQEYVRGNI